MHVRLLFAYAVGVQEEDSRDKKAILVAAAIICAVRTAREENIMPTSPRILSRVSDFILLARLL